METERRQVSGLWYVEWSHRHSCDIYEPLSHTSTAMLAIGQLSE